ncbi:MAG TPA: MFS transporter [Burkholderiaceae bacterium]|nr:MFS transporter [Burkholderiaceae bacterium]
MLAFGNLVVGTGAFMIGGIVEPLSRSLGTSVSATGQLMTVYSAANAIAAPLLLAAVGRFDARTVLLGAMALLVAANAASALSTAWGQLAAARVAMAMGAGLFSPTAAALGVALAPPALRGRALSVSFAGIGLSYVVGVPFGAWASLSAHGWPLAFWGVAALAAAVLVPLARAPRGVPTAPASLGGLRDMLRDRRTMLALGVTGLYFASIFSIFSYVGAFLREYAGVPAERVPAALVGFGVAALVGTFAGGALADRFGPTRMLYAICAAFVALFAAIWALPGRTGPLLALYLAWGTIGFAFYASQQLRLVTMAPRQATVVLALNASMIYVGTAAGAALGGAVIAAAGYRALPIVAGALIVAVAALVRATEPRTRA